MKSILHHVTESEAFKTSVYEKIAAALTDKPGEAYDYQEGLVPATSTDVDLADSIIFDPAEGEALDWVVDFQIAATVQLDYLTPDGEDRSTHIAGPCTGQLALTFPPTTLNDPSIDDILSGLDIEVDIYSAPLKDSEPPQEDLA